MLIDEGGHPKISSFGSAHISDLNLPFHGDSLCLTGRYAAPEILCHEFDDNPGESDWRLIFTKESDIYSFAYICFEVSFFKYF